MRELRYLEALREGLREEMERDPSVFVVVRTSAPAFAG
jgi:pyruvate/2-oxoglutarate/acetoin dehydrogenase E1 component